jgi:hypothetical protein
MQKPVPASSRLVPSGRSPLRRLAPSAASQSSAPAQRLRVCGYTIRWKREFRARRLRRFDRLTWHHPSPALNRMMKICLSLGATV